MKKLGILGLSISLLAASLFGTTVQAADLNKDVQNLVGTYEQPKEVDVNPIVVIESYSMDTTSVIYGEDYNLHLTFKNESKTSEATEILVTYAANATTQYVAPVYGNSNTFYIEEIKADSTYEMDLPICVLSSKSGYVQIPFTISYAANGYVHSTNSYVSFKINAGNQAVYYGDEFEQPQNIVYVPVQNTQETEETGNTSNQTNQTSSSQNSNSGLDSTTIIMGVAVIVAILALFGLIFGRKKK